MGWEITLEAPSGLLVGSLWDPAAGAHLVTATVTVEGERRALLPGSSLRGALREALRRFALARGAGECTDQPDCPCPTCALFGAADRPGKLRVHSALFPARLDLRAGVAIDRVLRTAWREGGALWTERRAVGEAVVRVDVLRQLTDQEEELLEVFWAWLEATGLSVGQRKSVGAGALSVRVRRTEERARAVSSPPPGRRRPYALRVVLLEPAHLVGPRQRDFYRDALDVIPTSTLRGAVGRALEVAGAPEVARDLLLGPRPLLLGPALPVDPASPPGQPIVWTSRRRCRGSPAHVVDVAIPTTAVALGVPSALGGCPLCSAALGEADRPPVTPLVLGHTPIDPATRRAQEGGLHFQVAAAPGAVFEARALLSDGEAELIASLREVVVGGRRARGMGRAALTVHELPDLPPIQERLARTREALEAQGAGRTARWPSSGSSPTRGREPPWGRSCAPASCVLSQARSAPWSAGAGTSSRAAPAPCARSWPRGPGWRWRCATTGSSSSNSSSRKACRTRRGWRPCSLWCGTTGRWWTWTRRAPVWCSRTGTDWSSR